MNLIDTNIVLELLLEQDKAESVRNLFKKVPVSDMSMSDFSLHSIGIFLLKIKMPAVLKKFIEDIIVRCGIRIFSLNPDEIITVTAIANRFHFDFDDAYQYAIAEKYNLQIISFDKDFDRTKRGRKEPSEVIK